RPLVSLSGHARTGQLVAEPRVRAGEPMRSRPASGSSELPGDPRQPGTQAGDDPPAEVQPFRCVDSDAGQQVELRVEIELDDMPVPPRVEGVPAARGIEEPWRLPQEPGARREGLGKQIEDATPKAGGLDRRRRV